MRYKSLKEAALDLEKNGQLLRVKSEVNPDLEIAEIHRRVYDAKGPALLFENVKGSSFPALSNLYGTFERTRFLFRHTLERVQKVIELKADATNLLKNPFRYTSAPFTALSALPKKKLWNVPILHGTTTVDQLPLIKSWQMDGGAFVTMPQVITLPPGKKNIMQSNIGMYRVQLTGNEYILNKEIGMHYQLHRGIGVHHTQYKTVDEPFRASVVIGGPPSFPFSAIMPLPEGLTEMTFAGMLGGRRYGYVWKNGHLLPADADFVITGTIRKTETKPEGPFGDHLGYYSLQHEFPVMDVEEVHYRKDAIWHFSVVGRPPQEDSSFGFLIHELVQLLTPQEFPGIQEINAVDAAGVHPLLLAIGSERYMPFRDRKPEEILTQANRIIGSGQTSLAKFLFIAAAGDAPNLSTKSIDAFFHHVLSRVDWTRDLHFQTRTTIDTLDYSGTGWNEGSKLVVACCGAPIRTLEAKLPDDFSLPLGFSAPRFVQPGILAIQGKSFENESSRVEIDKLTAHLSRFDLRHIALVVVCDDSVFLTETLNNFLWPTFTRTNPSHDIYGVDSFTSFKHWGCRGPLVMDARIKPHHAPVLEPDKNVVYKVDRLFSKGGELYGKL